MVNKSKWLLNGNSKFFVMDQGCEFSVYRRNSVHFDPILIIPVIHPDLMLFLWGGRGGVSHALAFRNLDNAFLSSREKIFWDNLHYLRYNFIHKYIFCVSFLIDHILVNSHGHVILMHSIIVQYLSHHFLSK